MDMTNFAGTTSGSTREEQVFINNQWVTYRVRGFSAIPDGLFAPKTKTPYTDELQLMYESDLGRNMSVSAAYYNRRTRDIFEDFDPALYTEPSAYGDTTAANSLFLGWPYFGWTAANHPAANFFLGTLPGSKRDYNGIELNVTKRLANKWMGHASFAWNNAREHFSDPNGAYDTNGNPTPTLSEPIKNGGQFASSTEGQVVSDDVMFVFATHSAIASHITALQEKGMTEQAVFDIAINTVRTPLVTVQGAAIPFPFGGKFRQIQIDLDPAAMQARGLSANDVANALASQNLLTPAGTQKIGNFEYAIQLNNAPKDFNALGDVPVFAKDGAVVYLRDVAQVRDGNPPQQNVVHVDGSRSVLLAVLKNGATSTLSSGLKVKQVRPPQAAMY